MMEAGRKAVLAQAVAQFDKSGALAMNANAMAPGGTTATFQGGVMRGPLYNGQDYLGDDPDPNVRAFLLKNLSGRYGSSY